VLCDALGKPKNARAGKCRTNCKEWQTEDRKTMDQKWVENGRLENAGLDT